MGDHKYVCIFVTVFLIKNHKAVTVNLVKVTGY